MAGNRLGKVGNPAPMGRDSSKLLTLLHTGKSISSYLIHYLLPLNYMTLQERISVPVATDSQQAATNRLMQVAEQLNVQNLMSIPVVRTALFNCSLAIGRALDEIGGEEISPLVLSRVEDEVSAVHAAVESAREVGLNQDLFHSDSVA